MVDEKPRTLTRQLDAIPSELRAKPLKRRRVRLKPGDDQLERTTNELLSTVHDRRVPHNSLLATTRKPLPAIVPSVKSNLTEPLHGRGEVDDWLSHVGDDENQRRNGGGEATVTTRRKRERVSGSDPIFTETPPPPPPPSSLDLRIPRTRAGRDGGDDVITDHTRRRHDGADLNWLDDDNGGGGGVKKQPSTRRHRNGNNSTSSIADGGGVSDIQRLIAEGEDKLALDGGGKMNVAKPTRRRTSRRSIDTLKFDNTSSNTNSSNNKSEDDEDDSASQIGRLSTSTFSEISSVSSKPPGRRRNNARAELSDDDEDDDDLSASYDPSMLSLTSHGTKTRCERLTSSNGDAETNVFAQPKRHKKRDSAAILGARGGGRRREVGEVEAPWPDISDAKRTNATRQSRGGKMNNAYRGKYLPPLTENLATKNDKLSF